MLKRGEVWRTRGRRTCTSIAQPSGLCLSGTALLVLHCMTRHEECEIASKAMVGAHSRTIGTNFGFNTADSCNLVLAATFAKDSEYFDHCWLKYPDLLVEPVAAGRGCSLSLVLSAASYTALQDNCPSL